MTDHLTFPAEWGRPRHRLAIAIAAVSAALLIGMVILALSFLSSDWGTPDRSVPAKITKFTYSDLERVCAGQSLTVDQAVICNQGYTPADFAP